jgi:hypothetical protein
MKTNHYFLAAVTVAISMFGFAGCANNQQTTTNNADPTTRTYSGSDLERTGRQTAGEALPAVDPSITTSSGRR